MLSSSGVTCRYFVLEVARSCSHAIYFVPLVCEGVLSDESAFTGEFPCFRAVFAFDGDGRELLKNGCRVVRYFPSLLAKIGINESKTSECMILAITSARCATFVT